MPKEKFDYKNLNRTDENGALDIRAYGYKAHADKTSVFIDIKKENTPFSEDNIGWKFHISIDDYLANNLAKAWDIVIDVLIENRVEYFKVCKSWVHMDIKRKNTFCSDQYLQRGKQITIYDYEDIFKEARVQTWTKIFQEITDKFVENEIQPSYAPPQNNPIKDSSYVYYRYDSGDRKNDCVAGYNTSGLQDPYEGVKIVNQKQPVVPVWKEPVSTTLKTEEIKEKSTSANVIRNL